MFFRDVSLRSLGQTIQLGHYPGDTCTSPQRSSRPFTVVHTNGIHQLDILFCGCNLTTIHGDRVQQLMRRRVFPATTTDLQTGATFGLLDSAHVLSVQSKLSLYDFYISLSTLTNATGANVKVRSVLLVYYHSLSLTSLEESLPGIPPDDQVMASPALVETRRESPRFNRGQWYHSWGTRGVVPRLPISGNQSPTRLENSVKGPRVGCSPISLLRVFTRSQIPVLSELRRRRLLPFQTSRNF